MLKCESVRISRTTFHVREMRLTTTGMEFACKVVGD